MFKTIPVVILAVLFLHSSCRILYASEIMLSRTGQTRCYDTSGTQISCAGTGQDGEIQAGRPWPTPRFVDNSNGTITDNMTGLTWLKNANCSATLGGVTKGNFIYWPQAVTWTNYLASGNCGLTDGSVAGDWHLPTIKELESILNLDTWYYPLPTGASFNNFSANRYWSSTTEPGTEWTSWGGNAYIVDMFAGLIGGAGKNYELSQSYVLPVRGGQNIIPQSGQTVSYASRDDGNLRPGVPWPSPRFIDNGNGTATDDLTGLVWLKNANCSSVASNSVKNLASGICNLTDGSTAGDWRLPNRVELLSLIDRSQNAFSGSSALPVGHPFTVTDPNAYYASSTRYAADRTKIWTVRMNFGDTSSEMSGTAWPVRGGHFGNAVASVSPGSLTFGNVGVGTGSGQVVTIRNNAATGSSKLQINAIRLRGTNPNQYSINPGNGSGSSCGSTTPILAPGASCTFTVNFNPTSIGAKPATLRVSGSDVTAPNTDISLTGNGVPVFYTVTGSVSGSNGTISSANPATVESGTTTTFTLAPNATYQPSVSVSGTCPSGFFNGNTYTTGSILGDCTVGFSFVKITYPLTVTFQGNGTGTVTMLPKPPASDCGSTCSQSLEINTSVQLTANPGVSSEFVKWSGCDTATGNICTVTMNQAKSVTASFSYLVPINGVCGYYSTQPLDSPPTDFLCIMGTPSALSGTGPWSWTCSGINGGSTASCATISLNSGLVSWYPFNGSAGDASGNGNNLLVYGAVLTTDRSDNPDSAYALDGNSSYLMMAHSGSLAFTNAFTFSTWVNFNQINRTMDGFDQQALFAKKNYSQFGLVLTTEPTGNLAFHHEGLTPNQSTYNWTDVQPGTWYHLSVTYDGSKTRHFINGVLKAETTVSGTLAANTDDLLIGKSSFSSPEFPWEYPLDGKLDDMRFYNRALSAAEVTALYQATYPLSLTINGEGTGSVHSSPPPDISCLAGACAQSYSAGTVVNLTASAASGSAFTGWIGDCGGTGICSVAMDRARSVIATFSRAGDSIAPVITAFAMPATASALTVSVSIFAATDNVGVTGYLITQDATPPSATATGWSATAPVSYTFLSPGNCYAYAWAKDAAGNVSGAGIAVVNITISAPSDTVAPLITSFFVPSANTLNPAITAFAVIDNVGVTGYLVSETGAAPLANDPRWVSTAPGSYTFAAYGAKTLYAWAKDAAGNISPRVAAYPTLLDPAQTIDTLLTGWPANPATSSPSTFFFTANQAGATFECNMDGQTWYVCTSPASFGALANGGHMFSVRAKTSGGSYDASPVSFIWTVAVPLVQMNLTSYTSLADAYSDSSNGSILMIKGMEFGTVPVFDKPVTITLQGGYDSAFTGASGTSTLHGTLTISAGTITFDRINIQ